MVINGKAPLAVSGQAVSMAEECTVFSVNKVDGVWLWIKSEQAYLRRGDVVPFEDLLNSKLFPGIGRQEHLLKIIDWPPVLKENWEPLVRRIVHKGGYALFRL